MKYSLAEIDIMRRAIEIIEYYNNRFKCVSFREPKETTVEAKLRTLMLNGTLPSELIERVNLLMVDKLANQGYHTQWGEWLNEYESDGDKKIG